MICIYVNGYEHKRIDLCKIIMEEDVAEKIMSKHNLKRITVREVLCDEVGKSYI